MCWGLVDHLGKLAAHLRWCRHPRTLAKGGAQRLAFRCQAFQLGPRFVEDTANVVTGRGQDIASLAEVVGGQERRGIRRVFHLAQTARGADLGGKDQEVAPGFQQDAPDVGTGGRDDVLGFPVGGAEDLLAIRAIEAFDVRVLVACLPG